LIFLQNEIELLKEDVLNKQDVIDGLKKNLEEQKMNFKRDEQQRIDDFRDKTIELETTIKSKTEDVSALRKIIDELRNLNSETNVKYEEMVISFNVLTKDLEISNSKLNMQSMFFKTVYDNLMI
jgi:chromosome segregation ATPase